MSYSCGFTSTTGHAAVLADGFVELNVSWFDLYLNDFVCKPTQCKELPWPLDSSLCQSVGNSTHV